MGYDGAGGYTRSRNFSADASANIRILASAMDQEIDDIASAMEIPLLRDGQNSPTADIPMGGFRFINAGAAQSANDYLRAQQFIEGVPIYMIDTATSADRISVSSEFFTEVSPSSAPADGTRVTVKTGSHKSAPVFLLDGFSANVIEPGGARVGAVMASAGMYDLVYSSSDSGWLIKNPTNGRTQAEVDAGVTPTNCLRLPHPMVDVTRYGINTTPGTTDMTAAFQAAANVLSTLGGGTLLVPPGTYVIDPDSPVLIDGGVHIYGYGATLKLKDGTYSFTTSAFIRNSADVAYNAGTSFEDNITIAGLKLDGNIANVTLSASGGVSGLVFYQCNNVTIRDVEMVDLPGTNGNGYGIIARYSNNVNIYNPNINRTDRQNIMFHETTGSVVGGKLRHSFFRDCIAVGGDVSNSYQYSYVVIDGVDADNSAAVGGGSTATRTIRFTAGASGVIKNSKIVGKTATGDYAIYLSSVDEQDVAIVDNTISGGEYTVLVESTSKKNIRLRGNTHRAATNGFRFNAAAADGVLVVDGDTFDDDITTLPVYINSCDNVTVKDIHILGGSTSCFIGTYKSLVVKNWNIEGMTDATRVLNISTAGSGNEPPIVNGVITRGNTADSINIDPTAFVTDVKATLTGAGIKLGKFGSGYLWRDTTGDLRIDITLPTSIDSDGTVVGTQT